MSRGRRRSFEIVASPNTRLELGRCLRAKGRLVAAYAEFGRTMVEAKESIAEDQRYQRAYNASVDEWTQLEPKLGFVMLTISLITMHTMDLSVSYGRLVFLRCFQASGLAFLFIPINTIAYIGVKQSENNDVSGLTNLARNIGGSCGTAFMATMLTRRTAAHENNMVRNLTTGNPAFMNQVAQLKGMFGGHTSGTCWAALST